MLIAPSDKQLVEVFCQSVTTHSVAQVEQRWEVASVPGEDHCYRTAGHPLLSRVWNQLSQTHPGSILKPLALARSQQSQQTCLIGLWMNEKKCTFRSRLCPGPNVKLEKEKLSAKRLYCQAKIKCWWVFVWMHSHIFNKGIDCFDV